MTLKNLQPHVWRPDPEVENRPKVNSDVTTRQMTPEEREKYKNLKPKHMDAYGRPVKPPVHKDLSKFSKHWSKEGKGQNERSD